MASPKSLSWSISSCPTSPLIIFLTASPTNFFSFHLHQPHWLPGCPSAMSSILLPQSGAYTVHFSRYLHVLPSHHLGVLTQMSVRLSVTTYLRWQCVSLFLAQHSLCHFPASSPADILCHLCIFIYYLSLLTLAAAPKELGFVVGLVSAISPASGQYLEYTQKINAE